MDRGEAERLAFSRRPGESGGFPVSPIGRFVWAWTPAVIAMAGVFFASSIPSITTLPGGMSDHQWHFLGYAMLGLTFLHGTARGQWEGIGLRSALTAWGLAALYGASDEWHQSFVPGRFAAVDDWFADVLGAGVAILIVAVGAIGRRLESETV